MPLPRQGWFRPRTQYRPSALLDIVSGAAQFLTLLAVFYQYFAFGRHDPYNCRALLNDGSWPPVHSNSELERDFGQWEPTGCRMVKFSTQDFHECLGGRRVVLAGDSTIRQVYWAAAARLDHVKAHIAILDTIVDGTKHHDLHFEAEGVHLDFIWDPWLNSSSLEKELTKFRTWESFTDTDSVKPKDKASAALVILGAPGLWAARHGREEYLDMFTSGLKDIRTLLRSNVDDDIMYPLADLKSNYDSAPNQILIAPVQPPMYRSLSPGRAETITPTRVDKMNNYLAELSLNEQTHILWSYNKMTQNQWSAFEETGIHVVDGVAERKIDIALNVRCNAAAIGHEYPNQRTCCVRYPYEAAFQPTLIFMAIAGLPLLLWLQRYAKLLWYLLPSDEILKSIRVVLLAAVWCWFADRTHWFAKAERHYHQGVFIALCVVFWLVSLLTVRRSKQPLNPSSSGATSSKSLRTGESKQGFLSRDQSDEWKGWMQALILIYHYNHASQTMWVYKIVRLLVSAYVFLSAYGHTMHLLKTEDFSLRRVASVVFRLNLLSAVLPYMMMTEYTFYYFAPVVTSWYLAVWLTLRCFRQYNQDPLLLFAKILVAAMITSSLISIPGPLELLSTVCRVGFRMPWDAAEARFRLSLERYVVYVGMMTASAVHRIALLQSRQVLPSSVRSAVSPAQRPSHLDPALATIAFPDHLTEPLKPVACAFSVVFILFFFVVTQKTIDDKEQYNLAHPYMSWVPILSFLILRNSHQALRSCYLALPAALGRISLETYVLQYHVWLAGDASGILRIGIWDRYGSPLLRSWLAGPGRALEAALLTVLFLCLSAQTRHATESLTHWMFGSQRTITEVRAKAAGLLVMFWMCNLVYQE